MSTTAQMRWYSAEPFPAYLTLVAGATPVERGYVPLEAVLDVLRALGVRPVVLARVESELRGAVPSVASSRTEKT